MFVEIVPAAYAQAEGVVRQQEGLVSMVTGSGLVVQLVLYLLILFSVFSWGIIFYKLRQVRVARRQSARFIETVLGNQEPHDDSHHQSGASNRARWRRCSAPGTRSWCA